MNELRAAIYNKSQETSAFKTAISGRFYFDKAPQTPTYPFVVCHEIVNSYDFMFSEEFQTGRVQFSIYSNSPSATEAGTIFTNLKSLFDWVTLTVSGYTCVSSKRLADRSFWNEIKMEYIYTVDYEFFLEKNG